MICSHFGGWELAGQLLITSGPQPKILMLEAEHEKIRNLLERSSSGYRMDIIPVRDDLSHVLEINKSLKQKEIIAVHGDRFMPGSQTIKLPFLGKQACFPLGPFALAVKLDVPVSFVFVNRKKGMKYHCVASRVYQKSDFDSSGDRRQTMATLAETYVQLLESHVRKHPEQWFNYYEFWETEEVYDNP